MLTALQQSCRFAMILRELGFQPSRGYEYPGSKADKRDGQGDKEAVAGRLDARKFQLALNTQHRGFATHGSKEA